MNSPPAVPINKFSFIDIHDISLLNLTYFINLIFFIMIKLLPEAK